MREKLRVVSFFAGVGGIELGLEQTGEFETIYANEFDSFACKTYAANHPNTYLDKRDIHDVKADEIPECDLIVGGFPCQAFSIAGYQKGFSDRRGNLFFEMLRVIKAKNPRIVLFENVKNLINHGKGTTFKTILESLNEAGYHVKWQVLNSKDYNVPQNRERVYIVGFKDHEQYSNFIFPAPLQASRTIKDIIDFDGVQDEKYYYRPGKQKCYPALKKGITSSNSIYQWRRKYVRENKKGLVPTLTANMGMGGNNVPLILTNNGDIRKLTPSECFYTQGYPKSFKLPLISDSQLYKQAGNSVTVPVIKEIAKQILRVL